jgi:hypothetical protein
MRFFFYRVDVFLLEKTQIKLQKSIKKIKIFLFIFSLFLKLSRKRNNFFCHIKKIEMCFKFIPHDFKQEKNYDIMIYLEKKI